MSAAPTEPKRPRGRPRKATAAPVAPPAAAAIPADLQFTSKPAEVETEPLFSIDDTVYEVPKEIHVNKALKYLDNLRLGVPEMVSMAELFVAVIGEPAFVALTECEGLTKENLQALMVVIRDKTLGGLDEIKGE